VARQRTPAVTPRRKTIAIIARCRKPGKLMGYCRARKARVRHGGRSSGPTPGGPLRAPRGPRVRACLRDLSAHAHDGMSAVIGPEKSWRHRARASPPSRVPEGEQIHARSFPTVSPASHASPWIRAPGGSSPSARGQHGFPLLIRDNRGSPASSATIRRPRDESSEGSKLDGETTPLRRADIPTS